MSWNPYCERFTRYSRYTCSDKWFYLLQCLENAANKTADWWEKGRKREESASLFWNALGNQILPFHLHTPVWSVVTHLDHIFLDCFPLLLRAHLETKSSSWQEQFTVPSGTPTATAEVNRSFVVNAMLNKCKIFSHKLLRWTTWTLLTLAPIFWC